MKENTEREQNSTIFENIGGFDPINDKEHIYEFEPNNPDITMVDEVKNVPSSLSSIVIIKCDSSLTEKSYKFHLNINEHINKERFFALNRRAVGKSPKTPTTITQI